MITVLSLLKIYWGPKPSTKSKASDVITEFVTGCNNIINPNAFSAGNYTTERGLRELPPLPLLGNLRLDKNAQLQKAIVLATSLVFVALNAKY